MVSRTCVALPEDLQNVSRNDLPEPYTRRWETTGNRCWCSQKRCHLCKDLQTLFSVTFIHVSWVVLMISGLGDEDEPSPPVATHPVPVSPSGSGCPSVYWHPDQNCQTLTSDGIWGMNIPGICVDTPVILKEWKYYWYSKIYQKMLIQSLII